MTFTFKLLLLFSFLTLASCNPGKLDALADIPSSLHETSAIEVVKNKKIVWIIEDAGNKNHLYGFNTKMKLTKNIEIENAENIDWEDLTSDNLGNIYIGDFGNNSKERENFTIYKISNPEKARKKTSAEVINFSLPEDMKSADFESFFLFKNNFYIFTKDDKKCELLKVPNQIGDHVASYISEVKLKGKNTKVTSADISDDGKIVVLLNHDRLWKLTKFKSDDFFNGTIEELNFDHDTQKEGINLIGMKKVLLTDEKTKNEGGKLYLYKL
ncbi:hypothetical protein WNY78_01855 [Psychroserpens sp. AS72]|uniref:hypothetical protein n=1 Tax=Psychroserpens sp. AS72 TaxID=3135775 RepID=UPI0031768956